MKIKTDTNIGQQEYSISGELLGIHAVRINGRKVNAEFIIKLPRVPKKQATMVLEIEKMIYEN